MSRYAVREAERVKDADPALFEQVKAGAVPLRGAVKEAECRDDVAIGGTDRRQRARGGDRRSRSHHATVNLQEATDLPEVHAEDVEATN